MLTQWLNRTEQADSATSRTRHMHVRDVLLLTVLFLLALLCLGSIASDAVTLHTEQKRMDEMISLSENALVLNAKVQQTEQAKMAWLLATHSPEKNNAASLKAANANYRSAFAEFQFALNALAANTQGDEWAQELIEILRRESHANMALYIALNEQLSQVTEQQLSRTQEILNTDGLRLSESVSALVQTLSLNFSRKAKLIGEESVNRSQLLHIRLVVFILIALVLMLLLGWLLNASSRKVQNDMDVLEREALTDPLTAMPNVRAFKSALKKWMHKSRRKSDLLTLVLIDLDHFKRYNDTHGHPAGDRLLTSAASAWMAVLPERAFLARIGGEEFALILPNVSSVEAESLIHEMLKVTPDGQTFSAGISLYSAGEDATAFVSRADRALYRAKKEGRNRVSAEANSSRPSLVFSTFNLA